MVQNNTQLAKVQAGLRRKKLDGLLITQPENRRYLSGYTAMDNTIAETSGVLLVPGRGNPLLLTDSRYQLQAEQEAAGFEVLLYEKGLHHLLERLVRKLRIKRLGFESHYMLHSTAEKLHKVLDRQGTELLPLTGVIEAMRLCKQEEELARIRKSVQLNEIVLQEVVKTFKPGMTEREAALRIEDAMRRKGAERPSFETIIAGGPNGAKPHAVPSDRPLRKGEPIIVDMGLQLNGYCSDMTRTVFLGAPDPKAVALSRIVRRAQQAAIARVRAGIAACEVDRAARELIAKEGYGTNFGHGLGHGVGLAVHEAPAVNRRNRQKLTAGMVITIEPGIYLPGWGGIRLEQMVAVTAVGCEVLNRDTTFLDI